jgi:hypothetical protein
MSLPVANTRHFMSEWPNRWMQRLLENTDWGVDTACGCNCHCLCLWFFSVARVLSGFVMIVRASGLEMGVGRFSRPWRGVGLLAMPDVRLVTTWLVESVCEVPLGAGVLRLLVPYMAVGEIIDRCCVADGVTATRWVISATPIVSNGSGPSLRVLVWVQTKLLPNWPSGSSRNPNCPLGYGFIENSQPVWMGRVVSGSPSGSIYSFIFGSWIWSLLIVSYQNCIYNNQQCTFAYWAVCNIN